MARPKFRVQHFIACLNAAWEGFPGPGTLCTLEGVGYAYRLPPDAEFPFEELEIWLYARFYRTNGGVGRRQFSVDVYWCDAPGGAVRVGGRRLGSIRFSGQQPVVSAAWPVRPMIFPGTGLYEFRLLTEVRRVWGVEDRPVLSEFIRVEKSP
jgi:hypothetical protein